MDRTKWAYRLISKVYAEEGRHILPHFVEVKSKKPTSWGYTTFYQKRSGSTVISCNDKPTIKINFDDSHDLDTNKCILLHEISHALTKQGHTKKFWKKTWALYRRHRIPRKTIEYVEYKSALRYSQ